MRSNNRFEFARRARPTRKGDAPLLAAQRGHWKSMEATRSIKRRFITGYVPYTAVAIAVAYLVIASSRSWAAVLAGGVILIGWSVGICICQLAILFVPYPDKSGFHSTSVLITLASMFLAPVVIAALVWLISTASKLAS